MPLTVEQLRKHYDKATAEAILELIKDGSIDRPSVSQGEKYIYIDTRILRAPYGVISQHEVKAACAANLSGTAWGVYCYLLTCMSGRLSPKGTEIGGKQIMKATGYSKPSVYRACIALEKAGLIRPSNATLNRRAWLLCNPHSDDIQDAATEEALQQAENESHIKKQVRDHNSNVKAVARSVNNPVDNPVNSFKSEKRKSKNSEKGFRSETNINTDHVIYNSNLIGGGKEHDQLQYSQGIEFKLIQPYLMKEFSEQVVSLRTANSDDDFHQYQFLKESYDEMKADGEDNLVRYYERELELHESRHHRSVLEIWKADPYLIADDLLNRRDQKTCKLRYWGWSGTQSLKKVAAYIVEFVLLQAREYPYFNPYTPKQHQTQDTRTGGKEQ